MPYKSTKSTEEINAMTKRVLCLRKERKLITRTRTHFEPFYQHTDAAHQLSHVDDVCVEALRIASLLDDDRISRPALILAAYAHDMFTTFDREEHHAMAHQYIKSKTWQSGKMFTDNEIAVAAEAALSHRASWGGIYADINAEIIATADRGRPIYEAYLIRSFRYANTKLGKTYDDSVSHALTHIVDKFSPSGGYAKRGQLYSDVYKDDIETFNQKLIETTYGRAYKIITCAVTA